MKTHHEGDNQTNTAYLPGDRTPKKTLKAAYKWGQMPGLPSDTLMWVRRINVMSESEGEIYIRRRIVLSEKLPEANASEPR